jgi:hypothetical protein
MNRKQLLTAAAKKPALTALFYKPRDGSYAGISSISNNHINTPLGFYSCRESFHYRHKKLNGFVMRSLAPITRIRSFIKRLEDKLKIPAVSRTQILPTLSPNFYTVIPAPWWNVYDVRRQFLTIALRLAKNYKNRAFKKALYSHYYTKSTRPAVERFLKGYTKLQGVTHGWVSCFGRYSGDKEDQAKMLKK